MKKVLSLLLVVLLLVAVFAGCQDKVAEEPTGKEPIVFALVAPMTGDSAQFGLGFRLTVESVVKDWNDNKGGLLGRKIEIIEFDDKQMPEEAANVAQRVVSDKRVVAVIGHHNSSCSMAGAVIYEEADIVQIAPSSSNINYTKLGINMFRIFKYVLYRSLLNNFALEHHQNSISDFTYQR